MRDSWRHRRCLSLWTIVFTALAFDFQAMAGQTPTEQDTSAWSLPKAESAPFNVGERLRYRVRYGMVTAGSAEMAITELANVRGRECLHAVTTIRSSDFFSAFFKVRDRVESFIDRQGIFPWRFEKRLREGKYRADVQADYYHKAGIAIVNGDTVNVPPFVQDVLSIFYYVRTQPLEVGKSLEVTNHDNKKVVTLELSVRRKERVKTKAGEFEAYLVVPRLKETGEQAGLFRQKGQAWIWFSNDSRKIPVLIKSKMYFGSLTLELVEADLPELAHADHGSNESR